jgi:hypothetical protein
MANGSCCQLVGSLSLGIGGCITSISTNYSTEIIMSCGGEQPLEGPSVGTVNITAFADTIPWIGCPSKAGLSVSYVRKYDCENDIVYFIPSGQGQSFISGDLRGYVSIKYPITSSKSMNANSSSGPTSIYMSTTQTNGYGLSYSGQPISIDTTPGMAPINLGGDFGGSEMYLQNFSFDANPAQLPIVTYSYIYGKRG